MASESLLVSASLILIDDFNKEAFYVSVFLSISSLMVLPTSAIIAKLAKEYQERKIILILTLIGFISSVFLISYPYFDVSFQRYFVFFVILFVVTQVLESVGSALLAKIYPANLSSVGVCNVGFTIIFTTTGGKFIGASMVSLIAVFTENLTNTMFIIYSGLFFLLSVFVYFKNNDLRIKAIARIIHRKQAAH